MALLTSIEIAAFPHLVAGDANGLFDVLFLLGELLVVLVYLVTTIASGILFCVFMHRTNKNLTALGMGLEFGPNAWGWFFCPVLSLWKPYQAVAELWRKGAPEQYVMPRVFSVWWGTWIVGNLMGQLEFRLFMKSGNDGDVGSELFSIVSGLVTAVAGIAAAKIIGEIYQRTQARAKPGIAERAEAFR